MIPYDIETYPNVFTFAAIKDGETVVFEISDRKNQLAELTTWLDEILATGERMVGYNNLHFDYPVIHCIMQDRAKNPCARQIYHWAQGAVQGLLKVECILIPQIDLFKIWHFDNKARSTSLKALEFALRLDNVEDLPFDYRKDLSPENIDKLIEYNINDVQATAEFLGKSKSKIEFRDQLSKLYGRNFTNFNDTKIGKSYFTMRLEKAGVKCFKGGNPVQTIRKQMHLKDAVLPWIEFESEEFTNVLNWFKAQTIHETKGVFKNVSVSYKGFQFDFGTGGIHGSLNNTVVKSDDEYIIEDWDVASYYPNLSISNRFCPEHLGEIFCDIYGDMYQERVKAKKEGLTDIVAMLKLALNGVFGDSNNVYSQFYDPLYTMKITINGQLLLCMLAEKLMDYGDLQLVQINTDGLTVRYPRYMKNWVHKICKAWENTTKLTLENAEYSRMFIRDVNNYIAEYTSGKLKRKGAYEYEVEYHQDPSALVVQKAVEANLIRNTPVAEFIHNHNDVFDFMLRAKVPKNMTLLLNGEKQQNITRYYISKNGGELVKQMQPTGPLGQYKKATKVSDYDYFKWHAERGNEWNESIHTKNKSTHQIRNTRINNGYLVKIMNKMTCKSSIDDLDYGWYIKEAEKLTSVFDEK